MALSKLSKQLKASPNWGADGSAALTNTLTMIPDALANALLMGVNPVFGLHALMVGTPLGALFSGSEFMTISLRGRNELGSTFINLLQHYAQELCSRNSKLMLVGVALVVMKQLTKTGATNIILPTDIFPATPVLGESL